MDVGIVNVGSVFVPGWVWFLAIVGLVMFAFGWWSKLWEWVKPVYAKLRGKPVSASLDAQVIDFFTRCKSGKVVWMLKQCAEEFEEQGDATTAKGLRNCIPKAVAWKEE